MALQEFYVNPPWLVVTPDREDPDTGFDDPTYAGACEWARMMSAEHMETPMDPIQPRETVVMREAIVNGDGVVLRGACSSARFVDGKQMFPFPHA